MSSTGFSLNLQTGKQITWAASVVLVGSTYFALIIAVLHFLRPDLNPISLPTSRYAIGPYGFLMTTAFLGMSVASFALVVGLYQGVAQLARSRTGLVLLGVWALGVLIAMIFPMDIEGAPQTLAGTIHQTTGPLAFLCMSVGVTLVSWRFKQDDKWRPFHRTALLLSLLTVAGFIATFLSFVAQSEFLGLTQRITLALLVTWMLLAAVRLRARP
jgi:hypothetical protein